MVAAGFLFGLFGCLEKEEIPVSSDIPCPNNPFGLFKIHLTLVDTDTKEPLPDLRIHLSNNTSFQINGPGAVEQVTNGDGVVHITIAAAPPVPQEFVLSLTDITKSRSFQQAYISIRFIDPNFKFIPEDAKKWGKLYQGTAELTLTRELKQIRDESYRF